MPTTTGARDLGELIDYLRATACASPGDTEHDHELCREYPVADVAAALVGLIRDPSAVSAPGLATALDDDENRRHVAAWPVSIR